MTALLLPGPDFADRFAATIDGLCRAIAVRSAADRAFTPFALVLWGWLRRVAARVAVTAARAEAGTLRPLASRRRASAQTVAHRRPALPRGFGWLVRTLPQAGPFASQIRHMLAEEETVALLAAAPQLARSLRPLCRLLGVTPSPALPLPRHAPPAPADAPPPRDARRSCAPVFVPFDPAQAPSPSTPPPLADAALKSAAPP